MTSSSTSDPSAGLQWHEVAYTVPLKKAKEKKPTGDPEKGKGFADSGDPSPLGSADTLATSKDVAKPSKRILRGVSGYVRPGELVGILGASGAGKTTLLNVLSARMSKQGKLEGSIAFNGKTRIPTEWKRTVGYVEQDDLLLPTLTVQETVEFAARMKLPNGQYTNDQRKQMAVEAIEMLRLEGAKDTKIGGGTIRSGISGGERKRTSIATELVSPVSLLFLDEPSSGLDSFSADNLVQHLSHIVKERHIACLMTVHQPSWKIFSKLNRVILMTQGSIYYDGPPAQTIGWFEKIGFQLEEGMNPADQWISIAEMRHDDVEGQKRVDRLVNEWAANGSNWLHNPHGGSKSVTPGSNTARADLSEAPEVWVHPVRWPRYWHEEFWFLLCRWYTSTIRDKQIIYATAGQGLVMLIVAGFGFFRLTNKQSDVLPKVGVLFFLVINTMATIMIPLVTSFPLQRSIMIRERSAGLYRTSSFFLSKLLIEIPVSILQKFWFLAILYFMTGLNLDAGRFFIYMALNCVQLCTATCLGLAIGAFSPTVEVAQIISPMLLVTMLLFGGTFLPNPPPWFIWLKYISPLHYCFAALLYNEYRGVPIDCDGTSEGGQASQCYQDGSAVISAYAADEFSIPANVGFLCAIGVVSGIVGYAGLRWTAKPRMRYL